MHERQCGLALLSFDHALAQRPQDAALYGLRGQARRCINGNDGALDEWDRALAFDAMEANYLLTKGEALAALATYVRLCRDGSSCAPDDLAWAIDGIERAGRSDCLD